MLLFVDIISELVYQLIVLGELTLFALCDQLLAVPHIRFVVGAALFPFSLDFLTLLLWCDGVARSKIIRQVRRELLLTAHVEVVEIVEVRRFVKSRFNEVALEVQVIIAVLLNDISDGVALFKAVEGSLYDYVRKSREYNILEVLLSAVAQQLSECLFLKLGQRLSAFL